MLSYYIEKVQLMMENMGCLFNTTFVATTARFMLADISVLLQLHLVLSWIA